MTKIHPQLEKVARAMWEWDYQTQMFRPYEPDRLAYLARARAAVRALMEPDEGMVKAGTENGRRFIGSAALVDVFRAMLLPLVEGETK